MEIVPEVFSKNFELGFTYTRSTGPVVGRFFTELRDRKLVGVRGSNGKVLVPPLEYDPETSEPLHDFVEVGQQGVVKSWCWVTEPRGKHPMHKPFAWALIQLDGSDSSLLHCVDAPSASKMKTGMRVKVRWAEKPRGHMTDIACFDPI